MKLSIFKCLKSNKQKETSLDDIVRIMRSSEHLRSICERRRELLQSGNKEEADFVKQALLPAFAPCAFLYGGRARTDVTGLTNLCFLDIDHITDEKIEKSMSILRNDIHTVLAARSVSNDGLHILARYCFKDMEQPWVGTMSQVRMNDVYGCVYRTIKMRYEELLSHIIGKEGGNMERLCVISFDENLHYNSDAEPLVIEYEKRKVNKRPQPYKILSE